MSRLRSNKVVNQAGTGAPELTYGAVVPATGTISGACLLYTSPSPRDRG